MNIRLGLRNVDNGAGHGADHDHGTRSLALHQVTGNAGREKVGTVDVDGPQLAHAVNGVVNGLKVLGETSGGDEGVDLAVRLHDLGNTGVDGLGVGNVSVVSGDPWDTSRISN